ncbi:MAG TPA: hypothetical protein VFL76_10980 [Edaphocola sp.]|nr:hypothetical protein [Edaphocola sp.]
MTILRKIFGLLLIMTGQATYGFAAYYYDFNQRCTQAYEALTALKIQEGEHLLAAEKKANPGNLIPYFLDNYDDFLTILLTGDEQQYDRRKAQLEVRLSLLDKGPGNSPWYRYCKSSVDFQWAVLHIYFNSYLSAAAQFRNSFLLLKQNQKLFPAFKYNYILAGLEEAMVGTIPGNYQWIGRLFGMKGSVRGGTAKLVRFLNDTSGDDQILKNDAVFYYCYIKFFLLSDKQEVWSYLNRHYPYVQGNHLLTFLKANLAINDNQAALALKILNQRQRSPSYLAVPLFDYQAGIAALRLMDSQAPVYLKNFLENNKGKLFIKSACQKLSYYYLISGNEDMARHYRAAILGQGSTFTDADKKAQRYAESEVPLSRLNKNLIAAGLYCDGGNYSAAINILKALKPSSLANDDERTAYFYRYGRVYQLLGNTKGCIPFYKEAIAIGKDLPGQFAARSALELGHINEILNSNNKATYYYQLCLGMKNKDFKANLDQKAKAGLNRLKG